MEDLLNKLDATDMASKVANKEISPVELIQSHLDQIDRLNPSLNAIVEFAADSIDRAKEAENALYNSGREIGPLHGVPYTIKDSINVEGYRTSSGSLLTSKLKATENAPVAERLKNAGGILLGKTNTPEFGLLGSTENRLGNSSWENHCRNPWNNEMTSGGSSGGAASAISAGLCALATGSDGGGSIRIPASFCGVYGIKPTLGTIPRYPGFPTTPIANQTSQAGPITRTVKDSMMLLSVIAGHDERDPISLKKTFNELSNLKEASFDKLRIGWIDHFGFGEIDEEVISICKKTVNSLQQNPNVDLVKIDIGQPFEAFWTLFSTNVFASYHKLYKNNETHLAWYTQKCLEYGSKVTGVDYARAVGEIDIVKAKFASAFEKFDLIFTPTTSVPAFPVGNPPTKINGVETNEFWGAFPNTFPINMIGNPAASIPCGFTKTKLPVGLHIIGKPNCESTVLAASLKLESINPWIQAIPPVS